MNEPTDAPTASTPGPRTTPLPLPPESVPDTGLSPGEPLSTLRQNEPRNASALIFNSRGEYLLHLRDEVPGIWEPGFWSLLGGGREAADASLEDTVRRELEEEVALDLPVLEPFGVEEVTADDGARVSIQIFAGQWEGDAADLHVTEGVMVHWFRPDVMPRLRMLPSTLALVRRHAESRPGTSRDVRVAKPTPWLLPRREREGSEWAPNVLGVHLYLENEAGEVLLGLRHPDSAFAGNTWHFLAGHCEYESALACLVREAEEEAGLLIKAEDAELVHTVHMRDEPGGQPRLGLIFRVRRWAGQPELREPDRCVAWQWWDPAGLPDAIVPYTQAAIDAIRASRSYSEMGWA